MILQLIYDGDALKNNEIDPKELVSALVGLDNLLEETNNIINNGKVNIDLKVKASFQTGCFKIDFNLNQTIIDQAVTLFSGGAITAVVNAKSLIDIVFNKDNSLIQVLRFLKGKRPDKIFENKDGTFTVIKDGNQLTAEKKVLELYQNFKLRKAFEILISPIEKTGIDDFGVVIEGSQDRINTITKDEVGYFKLIASDEEPIDEPVRFETNVSVISLSFKEGNKWYVNDGESSFYVIVEDHEFLNKIDNNLIEFGKGDIFKVQIRKEQFYLADEKKLKTNHYIEKVGKHIKPSQQVNIF